MSIRLSLALERGLVLPAGRIGVFHPPQDAELVIEGQLQVIHRMRPDYEAFEARGFDTRPRPEGPFDASIVFLPRAKAQARHDIARAASLTQGPLVIDGARTDGVDSILKELRKTAEIEGPINKAHGKLFWLTPPLPDLTGFAPEAPAAPADFATAAGVFSADGIDPGSALLAEHLPDLTGRSVADLGAGWGYLSTLPQLAGAKRHLVEADYEALECARRNVTADASFHWADATTWRPTETIDAIVMNPPFHTSRAATPALGQAFIAAARRILGRRGDLWMVANRHLPYESTLTDSFGRVETLALSAGFKVIHASHPRA